MAGRRNGGGAAMGFDENERGQSARSGKPAMIHERFWMIVACLAMAAAFAIALAFAIYANQAPRNEFTICGQRPSGNGKLTPPRVDDLFGGFSEHEFSTVVKFLLQKHDLNLTKSSAASLNSNYIYMIEHHLPPKDAIFAHLQTGSTNSTFSKQAKVVLFLGSSEPKAVKEYLVYPVPDPVYVVPFPSSKAIPWKARPVCANVEGKAVRDFLSRELGKIKRVLDESFGQWVGGDCGSSCLFPMVAARAKPGSPERRLFVDFYLNPASVEGSYLYPTAFQVLVYTPQNSDRFLIEYLFYNGWSFHDTEALLQAYDSGTVAKIVRRSLKPLVGRYTSPRRRGEDFNADEKRPPVQYSPDGQRFKIDRRHVDYLGWSFDLYFRTVSGVELFNIKHNGQPVAFEIAMQDIVVIYGGNEPHNFFKTFFDAGYSLGALSLPLVRGADCPANAAYIDSVVYDLGNDRAATMNDAACVFEHKNSVPLRRHFSGDAANFNYAFSMPDSVLIVRQIVTVWNYDYIFDYEFHQNGLIEIKVSSTGYVVVTTTEDERYGFKLSNILSTLANVHGHYFHFKFDIDVAERPNSVTFINIGLENTSNPMVSESYSQMRITRTHPATEKESIMKYDFTKPKYYVVHSNSKNNSLGHRKGYRVHSSNFADVMLPLANPQMKGASWAKHQVVVTKQKDTERGTASIYTQGDPFDPVVDFQTFYEDDEPLANEDVVVWVTLGMHHIPCAEDVPVTTTPGRTLVASLVPFNYFDEDPSMGSTDAAVILGSARGRQAHFVDKSEQCIAPLYNISIRT